MRKLMVFTIIGALLWFNPAVAQNNIDSTPAVPVIKVVDAAGEHLYVDVKAGAVNKVPFSIRHPKLHKAGRKIRRTCQVLQPVVQFAGNVAQIVTMIK